MTLCAAYQQFLKEKISEGVTEQTLKYYKYNLPKFIEWCVDNKIENVEDVYTHLFEDYKLYLIENKNGTKKISLQTYTRAVKTFLLWLNENEFIQNVGKLKLIKAEIANIVPLSDVEVKILLNNFDNSYFGIRNKLMVMLMLDSGLIRGEVVSLESKNIFMHNNTMLVQGKGEKERLVPFGEETKRYINRYSHMRNEYEKRFFQKEDGTPITDNTIKMYFQDLKESTGIIRLHPHLLRHTFATNYILYGGDVEELRILLGHTSLQMTMKYVHLATQQRILNQRYHSHIDKLFCQYDNKLARYSGSF